MKLCGKILQWNKGKSGERTGFMGERHAERCVSFSCTKAGEIPSGFVQAGKYRNETT